MQYTPTGFPQYVTWYRAWSSNTSIRFFSVPYPSPVTSSAACLTPLHCCHRNPSRRRLLLLPSISVTSQRLRRCCFGCLRSSLCPTSPVTANIVAAAVSGHCAAAAYQPRRASFFFGVTYRWARSCFSFACYFYLSLVSLLLVMAANTPTPPPNPTTQPHGFPTCVCYW